MSDLRPDEVMTSSKTDGLAEYVHGMVDPWENRRDVVYRGDWAEYRRIWLGQWSPMDKDRQSERCKAIMPSTQQAVDSAVSEVETAIFGKERWFDVTGEGMQGVSVKLLNDMRRMQSEVSKCVLNAAIYGTGIGKILVKEMDGRVIQDLVAVSPFEFVIDLAAENIQESHGCAHVFFMPKNVVLERQRQGIYAKVDVGDVPQPKREDLHDLTAVDADHVRIVEYQGLVPARYIPDFVSDGERKMKHEDDKMVEALVTVANSNVILKAVENPFGRDRGFVSFQWDTVPDRFWGRGVVEKAYWPQKVLDAEVRARVDALSLSTHPMMAVNAAMLPRNADFSVRPGRNILLNGSPREGLEPLKFPAPDPQTYTQSQEMQRQIEMATGQLQTATPFHENGRNETASGMSMMLSASIRRTRRTMANMERNFIRPLIRKVLRRFQELGDYPPGEAEFKVHGTVGMMAREFEQMQLAQLLNALPPGPQQFLLLRMVVDNMSIENREGVMGILDQLLQQSMQPKQPEPDLGGQARLLSAQTGAQKAQHDAQMDMQRLQFEQQKMQLDAQREQLNHQRGMMAIEVDAERADSENVAKTSTAILNVAKAEAEELGKQIESYKAVVESLKAQPQAQAQPQSLDLSEVKEVVAELRSFMDRPRETEGDDIAPVNIERDLDGLITSVNGRGVRRNQQGLIEGLS